MKTTIVFFLVLTGIGAFAQAPAVAPTPAKARSAVELYEEGRAALFRDDLVTAKAKLSQVLRANPNHQPTIIMLKNIQLAEAEAAKKNASPEGRLQRIMLPQLDLADAKISEVLEFIQLKTAEQAGAAKPNFVVKLDPATEGQKITLKLGKVSVYDALRSVAKAASLDVIYDAHTVIIKPRSSEGQPSTAEARNLAPNTAK
ncbi:MAG: hypothetical protein ACR2OZ_18505 [Verrucomicrobiales bacterium]